MVLRPWAGNRAELRAVAAQAGTLAKFDVEMIGATADAIDKAEDRGRFREAMTRIGLETPRSIQTKNLPDALRALDDIGLPAIIRPSFTMGGTAAASPTPRPNSSRSSSAASTPPPPTKS